MSAVSLSGFIVSLRKLVDVQRMVP